MQSSYLLVQVTLSVTADLRHMYTGFRTVYLKYVFLKCRLECLITTIFTHTYIRECLLYSL